jgi:hypothetical protein
MPITTLKVLSTVLQLHGPGATIQSNAVLNDLRGQSPEAIQVYFRRAVLFEVAGTGAVFAAPDMTAADFAAAGSSEDNRV